MSSSGTGGDDRRRRPTISDARLASGTGRSSEQWFALLDGADATRLSHTQIARILVDEHEVPGWWAQSITVRYEQARGMRLPGQQADGTFSVSVSRSLRGGPLELLDLGVERFAEFAGGAPEATSRSAAHPTARWRLEGEVLLQLTVSPGTGGKCSVSLTQSRLRLPERVEPAREAMTRAFRVMGDRQN
ncbi:hypothetical protein [Frigoribacterium faeni]|uniref:hypothetical protein n=1 Tax=Frigoribacterium faeni TaxID=145483 RepID=UPI00141BD87B|nr:hypothetical protein [Frigoribacterium faeni]NIJ04906.1 hypothetical protein [Frigoribacterium faeni]